MSLLRKTDGHWGLQVAAVVALAVSSWPVWSHHSHGNYLTTEYTNLQGTVREFHWMNPHTWIYLDVMGDDGQATLWVL
ncbi:MAG: DUF6152 family protein, partial [Gammaproteobacteria bacterium]|nr:DUF6152 family protein [Gammaproteobacteria bacterium]